MNTATKRKAALAALENHARRYKVTIPERLKAFYAGDFDRYHLQHATANVSGFAPNASFQLALTPPTWLNKDDDAINGPRGEWEDAKHYVPLFVTDQSLYVVANLKKPDCPTGWYHEENWSEGPEKGAKTLDAFLASLTKTTKSDETFTPADPDQEDHWEENFADDGPRAFDVADDDDDD